jgi:hypothetical protein
MRSLMQRTLCLAIGVAVTGCAAIFNPSWRPQKDIDKDQYAAPKLSKLLIEAIRRVENDAKRYEKRRNELTLMRNSLPAVIFPLSAVALYRGTTQENTRSGIAAISYGSALLYSGSQIYRIPSRQELFNAAIAAQNCVLIKSRPLWVNQTDVDKLKALEQDAAFAALDAALVSAELELTTKTDANASAMVAAIKLKRDEFRATRLSAAEQLRRIDIGPALLDDARRAVDNALAMELGKTEPTLESILTAVKGLPTLATSFRPAASEGNARSEDARDGSKGDQREVPDSPKVDLTALKQALVQAADAHAKLAYFVAKLAGTSATPDLMQACAFSPPQAQPMTLIPDVPGNAVSLVVNQSRSIAVQVKDGIPAVTEFSDPSNALETVVDLSSGTVVINLTAKTATASPVVVQIIDPSGRERRNLSISITAAADTKDATGDATPNVAKRNGNCGGEAELDNAEIIKLQRLLGVAPTAPVVGPKTRDALAKKFNGDTCVSGEVIVWLNSN